MSTEEYAALGALAVLFGVVAWLVRRGPRRARRTVKVPDEFFERFEERAIGIATLLLDGASVRLNELLARLVPGDAMVRAQLDLTRALGRKLHELRTATEGDEVRHHEWDYLATTTLDRFPLLSPWLAELDQPALAEASRGEAELIQAVRPLVDNARSRLRQARASLVERPALLWTQLDLVVLTILLLDPSEPEQLAATRRLDVRPEDPDAARRVREALAVAIDILHATPRADRVMHDTLMVPPLDDRDLGAALVRHRIHGATDQDDLVRARALLLGDPELLWLALAVVEKTAYPEQAAAAYGRLAALVRRLLGAENTESDAEQRLAASAREIFDAEAAVALVETTRQLRDGRRPEELFAGADFDAGGST
jgi:hypothetical protein